MNHQIMINTTFRSTPLLATGYLLLATLSLLAGGCSSSGPTLTLTGKDHQRVFSHTFTQAYADRSSNGDYDIILVNDGTDTANNQEPGAPLHSVEGVPVRQVVHIRVLWRPLRGSHGDEPATSNAALHWYFLNTPVDGEKDILLYDGAGFVAIYPSKSSFYVSVRYSALKVTQRQGKLSDPVGPAELGGEFRAEFNPGRVRGVLRELSTSLAPTDPANAASSSPPARGQRGP